MSTDVIAALADELGRIGRRLDDIGAELRSLRGAVAGSVEHRGPSSAWPPAAGSAPMWPGAAGAPGWPTPARSPAALPPAGHAAHPSSPPGAIAASGVRGRRVHGPVMPSARLLAWIGGAVTLLGVVLLLALAASRGWLTPPARLGLGATLGVGLVGLALRLHRRAAARAGAAALAATGVAALYLVIAAAAALYAYLAAVPALLLALGVAGAGLAIADRWRTQLLASGTTAGAAVLAPIVADGWLLAALALALPLAALPVVRRRGWALLMVLAMAAAALLGSAVVLDEPVAMTIGLVAAVLAVGLLTAALAPRRVAAGPCAAVVALAELPALVGAGALGGGTGALIALGAAAMLATFAALPGTAGAVRVGALTAGIVGLVEAAALGLDGAWVTIAVLGQAQVAAAAAVVLRSRFAMIVGLVLGAGGLLAALLRDAPLRAVLDLGAPYIEAGVPRTEVLVTATAVAALVLALAATLLVAAGRLNWTRPDASGAPVWVPLGLAGLYGAASAVVTAALLVDPTSTGFTAGHAAVTVSWTVAALILLARGLIRPALRVAGLVLAAAAVVKLVLFDLVALDGLARVAAFLGAGLILLAAGTRYARLVAEAAVAPGAESDANTDREAAEPPSAG